MAHPMKIVAGILSAAALVAPVRPEWSALERGAGTSVTGLIALNDACGQAVEGGSCKPHSTWICVTSNGNVRDYCDPNDTGC